jgi:phage shock protein C
VLMTHSVRGDRFAGAGAVDGVVGRRGGLVPATAGRAGPLSLETGGANIAASGTAAGIIGGCRAGNAARRRDDVVNPGNALLRSRRDRMVAGVCGGIAHWLGWDPTVVRVAYVVLSVFSVAFPGILVYVILWLVMPEGD